MATFFVALIFFAIVMSAMAVGVIFSNKPIKGSCGGLNNIGLEGDCEICGGNLSKCDEKSAGKENLAGLAYDAGRRN
ncbi:(Na+)-NQR maturation NqrM [Ketobacter sp. MCCC 1A13808]|uniref:(Na+)-NQR maturation NqrM n=1 Tax=Ketobacter sp. MCCC 1A13808 TaxID=2602738 RepID=UPI000F1037A0|nr:(Na+)-NQR maturation NqrM [Ketobacter sp. MCCC 1A13808]MVF10716.1 (Na+)-NQR maturation NqrM [Ketobacter sp. MCCC 1A13808]RLP56134.1 MAG: (Na+)-NQR maturation NqrM [Ketobacter sp.]